MPCHEAGGQGARRELLALQRGQHAAAQQLRTRVGHALVVDPHPRPVGAHLGQDARLKLGERERDTHAAGLTLGGQVIGVERLEARLEPAHHGSRLEPQRRTDEKLE